MAYARNVTVMGYGDPEHNLLPIAQKNPETFYIGIDLDLPPLKMLGESENLRVIKDDFLSGLKKLGAASQDEIISEVSLGYYGRMGHRTWDEEYTRKVVDFAKTRLKPQGKLTAYIMEDDLERIRGVFKDTGLTVESFRISGEQAKTSKWMTMLQVHQGVQIMKLTGTKKAMK